MRALLDTICSDVDLHLLIRRLQHFSLIRLDLVSTTTDDETSGEPGTPLAMIHVLRMHPLVQEIARGNPMEADADNIWFNTAVDIMVTLFLQSRNHPSLWLPYTLHISSLTLWDLAHGPSYSYRRIALGYATAKIVKFDNALNPLRENPMVFRTYDARFLRTSISLIILGPPRHIFAPRFLPADIFFVVCFQAGLMGTSYLDHKFGRGRLLYTQKLLQRLFISGSDHNSDPTRSPLLQGGPHVNISTPLFTDNL